MTHDPTRGSSRVGTGRASGRKLFKLSRIVWGHPYSTRPDPTREVWAATREQHNNQLFGPLLPVISLFFSRPTWCIGEVGVLVFAVFGRRAMHRPQTAT